MTTSSTWRGDSGAFRLLNCTVTDAVDDARPVSDSDGGGAAGCNQRTGRCRTNPASRGRHGRRPFVNKERSAQEYLAAIGYPVGDEQ